MDRQLKSNVITMAQQVSNLLRAKEKSPFYSHFREQYPMERISVNRFPQDGLFKRTAQQSVNIAGRMNSLSGRNSYDREPHIWVAAGGPGTTLPPSCVLTGHTYLMSVFCAPSPQSNGMSPISAFADHGLLP